MFFGTAIAQGKSSFPQFEINSKSVLKYFRLSDIVQSNMFST